MKKRNYWKDKNNVFEEAKKYKTRTEFKQKASNAYDSARNNNWLDEMSWFEAYSNQHPKGYWKNKDNLINEAKKYTSLEEFKKNNLTAYLSAYKYGYMEEMHWLKKQEEHKNGWWTYENIEKEAVKYKTKTDFFKGNQTAYRKALKMGIIDDFFIDNYIEY